MSGVDELYPPAQYGWGWMLLAFGILVALLAAAWLVWFLTRPRASAPPPVVAPLPLLSDVRLALREEYLVTIQGIEDAYQAGEIDARGAHRELSRVVRRFVNEYSGLEAPVMSLQDLEVLHVHPTLAGAVRQYYPAIFSPDAAVDPVVGAASARQVVRAWY